MGRLLTIAIATVHPGLFLPPNPSDSVARVIENQISGLLELGHQVILLAPASSQVNCELDPICDTPIPLEADPEGRQMSEISKVTKRKLLELKGHADIVHAHSLDIPGILFTSNFLNDCPIPHVTTIHSCIELCNLKEFNACTGPMISLSFNQREACPHLHYVGNVYNGLDTSIFPFVEKADDYLCFLGRITPERQPHLALELAAYLEMPIKIAGPISNQEYFEQKCRPLLDNQKAQYLGELGMEEKIRLLAHARCNLHPTGFRDPCPLVPMEAEFCGTPTLAIRKGALPELVVDKITGVLVEDFAEAASKIKICFNLNRRTISEICRRRFNHLRMAKNYITIYHRILDEHECIFLPAHKFNAMATSATRGLTAKFPQLPAGPALAPAPRRNRSATRPPPPPGGRG